MVRESKQSKARGSLVTIGALLAGWVVVVVVGGGREPTDNPLLGLDGVGAVLFGGLMLLALLGLILLVYLKPPIQDVEQSSGDYKKKALLYVSIVIILLVLGRYEFDEVLQDAVQPQVEDLRAVPLEEPAGGSIEPLEPVAQAIDVLLVLVAIGTVGALWFLARRDSLPEEILTDVVDDQFEAELLVAIDDATEELGAGGDPRAAVLSAYASLEQVLASQENPRQLSETPTEHLRRTLANRRIDAEPLIRLGQLYELARFSDQEITTDQQDQAGVALQKSRNELAALR